MRPSRSTPNLWIVFADLFAGMMLFFLLALISLRLEVQLRRELLQTIAAAARVTASVESELKRRLPPEVRPHRSSDIEITIPARVLFRSFGYDDFLADSAKRSALQLIAISLRTALDLEEARARQLRVVIEGHTDSDPILPQAVTPQIPTNWELSSRRATGVLRFLADAGLSPTKYNVVATGLADRVPAMPDSVSSTKDANRRIVLRLEPDFGAIRRDLGIK